MTQRERILAIGVAGLIGLTLCNWLFGKYRSAVDARVAKVNSLKTEIGTLQLEEMEGEISSMQYREYRKRSLPGNKNVSRGIYQQWLLSIAKKSDLDNPKLGFISTRPMDNLYESMAFKLEGEAGLPEIVNLLHAFYTKDYLHRIRNINLTKSLRKEGFRVLMTIDAAAIKDIPDDAADPGNNSWRVDSNLAAYRDPVLNRNFFSPPNQPPKFTGSKRVEATVGRRTPIRLAFSDPEKKRISYSLVGEVPSSVRLDKRSGTLYVDSKETTELEVTVMAMDTGYPAKSTEQTMLVSVVEPPVKEERKRPPAFDEATRTDLTALLQGGDEWTAWLHVKTRDKVIKVREGDEFEIGTVKAKVVSVNDRFAEFESEDGRFVVKSGGNLAAAVKAAQEEEEEEE